MRTVLTRLALTDFRSYAATELDLDGRPVWLAGPNGSRIAVVGVCSAGPVDVPAGTASPLNVADWRDFPLMERVASVAPGLPSTFALDGVALAAAEQAYGAAAGHRDALVITVSTGIGGGLILDGS